MDNRNRIVRIDEMLRERDGDRLRIGTLRNMIIRNIGATERVITSTLRLMIDLGYIREVDNFVFEINTHA